MAEHYDFEKIWRRLTAKIPLKDLKKAKTDKERYAIFKKNFKQAGDQSKNLDRMREINKKNLYDYAIADLSLGRNPQIKESAQRFGEKRKTKITKATQEIKKHDDFIQNRTINKAGRAIVAKGKTVTIREKLYKGGQFLPKTYN